MPLSGSGSGVRIQWKPRGLLWPLRQMDTRRTQLPCWRHSSSAFAICRRSGRWCCHRLRFLDLKRLARVSVDRFHMPDELWVRIVYDFALAHRLRTLSRTHLLGALTPLYLGWVASYALEISNASPAETEQRLEKLARAYEDGKP